MFKIGKSIRKTELETKTDSATESFLNRPQDVINYIYPLSHPENIKTEIIIIII